MLTLDTLNLTDPMYRVQALPPGWVTHVVALPNGCRVILTDQGAN